MKRFSVGRGIAVLAFAGLLAGGCAGTEWQHVQVSQGYQPPKQVSVSLVVQANSENIQGAVAELKEAMTNEFAARKVNVVFVEPGAQPSTEVSVVEWDQGSRAMRWLVGFGAGEGHIIIKVKNPEGLDGQARGWIRSGYFGGSSYTAANDAGRTIARAIATGKP